MGFVNVGSRTPRQARRRWTGAWMAATDCAGAHRLFSIWSISLNKTCYYPAMLNKELAMGKQRVTGSYEVTAVGGEQVRAFLPRPLPPDPPLDLSGRRQRLLEEALLSLGRLDSVLPCCRIPSSSSMPMCVRKPSSRPRSRARSRRSPICSSSSWRPRQACPSMTWWTVELRCRAAARPGRLASPWRGSLGCLGRVPPSIGGPGRVWPTLPRHRCRGRMHGPAGAFPS